MKTLLIVGLLAALLQDSPEQSRTNRDPRREVGESNDKERIFGTRWLRHGLPITGILPQNNNTLISVGEDGCLAIWSLNDRQVNRVYPFHRSRINCAALSVDGETIAVGADEGKVALVYAATGKCREILSDCQGEVRRLCFSPDRSILVAGSRHKDVSTMFIWDLKAARLLRSVDLQESSVDAIAFNSRGELCYSDLQGIKAVRPAEWNQISKCPVRPSRLVMIGNAELVAVHRLSVSRWNVEAGTEMGKLDLESDVSQIAAAPSGEHIALGMVDGTVAVIQVVKEFTLVRKIIGHKDAVTAIAFAPDGERLITGSADRTIRIWEWKTGKEIAPQAGHEHQVVTVAFDPENQTFLSASRDGSIREWKIDSTQIERTVTTGSVGLSSFACDRLRTTGIVGTMEGRVDVLDLEAGKQVDSIRGKDGPVRACAFSGSGERFAFSSFDCVRVFQRTPLREINRIHCTEGYITCLALSGDGRTVATGDWSGNTDVMLWDADSGQRISRLKGHEGCVTAVAFSTDGKTLASGSRDQVARIWKLSDGQTLHPLNGHQGTIHCVAYSPDSRFIATGDQMGVLKVWEVLTGQQMGAVSTNLGPVRSVSFSLDNLQLVVGGGDTTAALHSLRSLAAHGDAQKEMRELDLDLQCRNLADSDAKLGFGAAFALLDAKERAIKFLQEQLDKEVEAARDPGSLIRSLDDEDPTVRRRSADALLWLGPMVEKALRQELQGNPTPEARSQVNLLLARIETPSASPYEIRYHRALWVLERIGTDQAMELVRRLSEIPSAFVRGEAEKVLERVRALRSRR